jgi:hypothetical protein
VFSPSEWAGMGMQRSKPEHPLRAVDISIYQPCFTWLREQVEPIGWRLNQCVFDPEMGRWYLYDAGQLVLRLEHETVERLREKLASTPLPADEETPRYLVSPADASPDSRYQE